MATITTNTFLDGGVARTAGEAWICNGGRLTIRTDSRWHANAPASMTGSLGSVAISATLGGGYTIDGRNVRWMAYSGGSGAVPAIGTTITQGGVSGYLLGVWASLTSAPTAVGAAVPGSGFLKFREVTGGHYAAGSLTGIGAVASSPDVVGWMEVVHDQAAAITVPRLGDFTTRGGWFALGTTTGAANQIVQVPTNGSATTYVPGVWIAKVASPATDEDWEYYPSIYAAGMIAANLGTDARSKFVLMGTNGTITIGHNGTTAIGYVPPAGRAIRIPNVLGRQCTTAARATNAIPNATAATRPDFVTTSAGAIDMEHFAADWFMSFLQPFSVRAHHVATFDYFILSEVAEGLDIYDGGSSVSQSIDARSFGLTSCFAGGTIQKWKAQRFSTGSADHAFEVLYCAGQTITDCDSGVITFARSSGAAYQVTQSSNITFNSCRSFNSFVQFTTSSDCIVNDHGHCDRYVGTTNTTGIYAIYTLASCDNILIDGVTFGLGGTIANVHPYLGVLNHGQSSNIRMRNIGTRAAFLSGGTINNPAYIAVSSGNNRNVKFQRCYMTPTRTGVIATTNSDKGMTYEHVYGDFADTITIADLNSKVKNCGGTNTVTGQASVYGTHFFDAFTSATAGRLVLAMNEPTTETAPYVTIVSGSPRFTSAGSVVLATVGDEVQWEMGYWCLGVTQFTNSAPIVTGTNVTFSAGAAWGNHNLYYQINTGAGYSAWKDYNVTNLAGETGFNPAVGFKIKFRAVCGVAAATNALRYVRTNLTSTLAAQTNNLYPLDTAQVQLGGLVAGSQVKATKVSDGSVLFNGTEVAGVVSFDTDFIGNVRIEARKASATPFYQPWVTQVTTVAGQTATATALQVLDE